MKSSSIPSHLAQKCGIPGLLVPRRRLRPRPPPQVRYLPVASRSSTKAPGSHHAPQSRCVATREGAWRPDHGLGAKGRGALLQAANQHARGGRWGRARWATGRSLSWPRPRLLKRLFQARGGGRLGSASWRRRSRRRRLTMNGPWYIDSRERVLKLGESFEEKPRCAFHTVRCE